MQFAEHLFTVLLLGIAMSKERGLICCASSVQAFLADRKSQTRRVIKFEPKIPNPHNFTLPFGQWLNAENIEDNLWVFRTKKMRPCKNSAYRQVVSKPFKCPYGGIGDRLYVRETIDNGLQACNFYYHADNKGVGQANYNWILARGWKLKRIIPSRYMPKILARIWLEITGIRVERVQDISWQDCKAEGITLIGDELVFNNQKQKQSLMRTKFKRLWDFLNAKRYETLIDGDGNETKRLLNYSWDKNPWVWVIEFKRGGGGT